LIHDTHTLLCNDATANEGRSLLPWSHAGPSHAFKHLFYLRSATGKGMERLWFLMSEFDKACGEE
jgi:hypothetical protein